MEMSSISASMSYSASWKSVKKEYQLTPYDPNKNFRTLGEMCTYLVELGNIYTKEFNEICNNSEFKVNNIESLKKEINTLFPQYTMVSKKPSDNTVNGKMLLYIDEANMEKMISDSGYKARIYGLMQRESLGFQGTTWNDVSFKMTGFAFTLCKENRSVDSIPYHGIGYGVQVNQGMELKTYSASIHILRFEAEFEEKLEARMESIKRRKMNGDSTGNDKDKLTYEFADSDEDYIDLWEQTQLEQQKISLQRKMDFQKKQENLQFLGKKQFIMNACAEKYEKNLS